MNSTKANTKVNINGFKPVDPSYIATPVTRGMWAKTCSEFLATGVPAVGKKMSNKHQANSKAAYLRRVIEKDPTLRGKVMVTSSDSMLYLLRADIEQ